MLERAIVAYACGESCASIARRLGINQSTLYYRFKRSGVVMRTRSEAAIGHPPHGTPTGHKAAGRAHHLKCLGNKRVDQQGYVVVNTGPGTVRREHVLIAEKALGRRLKKGEVVHHVDENRANNPNSNLLICNRAYHVELHARMRAAAVKPQE